VTRTSRRSPSGVPDRADISDSISLSAARWSALVTIGSISIASLLNCLRVDPVVLFVCANKPHIDHPIRIIYPYHQPIFVAGDIEYHSPVTQDACRTEFGSLLKKAKPTVAPCEQRKAWWW